MSAIRRLRRTPAFHLIALLATSLALANAAADDAQDAVLPLHVQAHRGAGIAAPENTLEAFQMSWRMGVTPEADLRTTKDGVIVCFHDPDLSRVVSNVGGAEKKASIEGLTVERVKTLEVGSFRGPRFAGQRVPLLADVFAAMRGRPPRLLYLDIKTADLDRLSSLVREYGVERQVIFTSEKYPLIREWKKRMPQSLTLLWNRGTESQLSAKLKSLREADFAGITHLQIHVLVGDLASDDPFTPSSNFLKRTGEELASRKIVFQVLPWQCADRRVYEKLLALGAASFATDYPDVTIAAIAAFHRTDGK